MKKTSQNIFLFLIGGISYHIIEILWRGYSYFSMFVLGGLCFVVIGFIREYFSLQEKNIFIQLIISSAIITILELIFGLILNIKLKLDIWDYSSLRFNFIGQISLLYTALWIFLSIPLIISYDFIKWWLFREEKPVYKINIK